MFTAITALEAKLEAAWQKIDGEARAEEKQLLADAKAEAAALKSQIADAAPVLAEFETGLKALVAQAEPQLKTEAETLLAKLVSTLGPLLGKAAAGL